MSQKNACAESKEDRGLLDEGSWRGLLRGRLDMLESRVFAG